MKFVIVKFKALHLSYGVQAIWMGAMLNTLSKYRPYRLIGKPRRISKMGKLSVCRTREYRTVIRTVKFRYAKKCPSIISLVKKGIHFKRENATINTPDIVKYLHADKKDPVIVFWNGRIDKELFAKFKIPRVTKFLNITTVKTRRHSYRIILKDMTGKTQREIFSVSLDYYKRNRKEYLNLNECHSLVCRSKHDDNEDLNNHDPCTNVLYTRCIFNFLMYKMRPNVLHTHFGGKSEG